MLKIKNLSYSYPDKMVFKKTNLELEKQKIYGLTGENGSGKTTLLKIISRLISSDKGSIEIDGVDITNWSYYDTPVSICFDEPYFVEDLTIKEHLILILKAQKCKKTDIEKQINSISTDLDLFVLHDQYPSKMSKGMKQRVNIAMAILNKHKVMLFDEPFSGLDNEHSDMAIDILKKLNSITNNIIIVSSHQEDYLKKLTNNIILIRDKNFSIIEKLEKQGK